jgi:hypothetical protein
VVLKLAVGAEFESARRILSRLPIFQIGVLSLSTNPPIILYSAIYMLNKELCYNCRKKIKMKVWWTDKPYEDEEFDYIWDKEGTCPCPYAFEDTDYVGPGIALCVPNDSPPPRKCPYVLEHVLAIQDVPSDTDTL